MSVADFSRPVVGWSSLIEETPTTIQIALATQGRGVVFASDTKVRVTEKVFTDNPYRAEGVINHPKITIGKQVAVALAGVGDDEADPARELADYLSDQPNIAENLSSLSVKWGNEYFQRKFPGQKHEFPLFRLLVVHPGNEYCQFRKLHVGHRSFDQPSSTYIFNGQEGSRSCFGLSISIATRRSTTLKPRQALPRSRF